MELICNSLHCVIDLERFQSGWNKWRRKKICEREEGMGKTRFRNIYD